MTTSTINQINIKNFHSIKNIKLSNLKNKKEIYIIGENGDGKTLLLQAIAIALKGTKVDGLGSFRELEGYSLDIPNKKECQNSFFAYGTSRGNHCQIKEDKEGYLTLFDGSYNLKSPKEEWLSQLYSPDIEELIDECCVESEFYAFRYFILNNIELFFLEHKILQRILKEKLKLVLKNQ